MGNISEKGIVFSVSGNITVILLVWERLLANSVIVGDSLTVRPKFNRYANLK